MTTAEAHWILTGYNLTTTQADYAIAHLTDYGTPLTEATLRDWAYTTR